MDQFEVHVNEGVVEATRRGCDWWMARRPMFEASGLIRDVRPARVVGGVVAVGPYDQDDADFMAGHMVQAGMPASAVTVKKAGR